MKNRWQLDLVGDNFLLLFRLSDIQHGSVKYGIINDTNSLSFTKTMFDCGNKHKT